MEFGLYFTEFGSFRGALRKSVRVRCRRKKFTFAISFPDEFLVSSVIVFFVSVWKLLRYQVTIIFRTLHVMKQCTPLCEK